MNCKATDCFHCLYPDCINPEPVRHGRWEQRVGSSITGQESAAFVTAPAAAQKWKVVQTDDAVQR